MKRRAALAAAVLPLLVLAGCAGGPPVAAQRWISGRLAVRMAGRSESAAFELRGSGDAGELRLLSPLGTVLASARWRPGQAVLTTADGQSGYADLDELSLRAFGEVLPLRALADWLAGRPWPGAASQLHAAGFEQLGWRVDTGGLAEGSLLAERSLPTAVVVRVRLDS